MAVCKKCKENNLRLNTKTIKCTHDSDGNFHSVSDRPSVVKVLDQKILYLLWHKNGFIHRENKPAYIIKSTAGEIIIEEWWDMGSGGWKSKANYLKYRHKERGRL